MDFNSLKMKQPRVMKILENSIKMNRLVQVILLEGAKGTPKMDTALYLACMLLCEKGCACGECSECKKVLEGIHSRVYLVDAIDKLIRKEQIESLEHEFSESGLEEGVRVFIINNIDKATLAASNSLLKFLEETKDDTYGILITDNINNVISTIKSRSQIISFERVSKEDLTSEYVSRGVDEEIGKVLSRVTNDTLEGMKLVEEGYIIDIIELVKKINEAFFTEDDVILTFNEYGRFLIELNEKYYHQIFLDILALITNDRLYHLLGKDEEMIFASSIMEIDDIYSINYNQTFKQLEKIIEYKKRLQYNVNMELFYMGLFLEMVKIYD